MIHHECIEIIWCETDFALFAGRHAHRLGHSDRILACPGDGRLNYSLDR